MNKFLTLAFLFQVLFTSAQKISDAITFEKTITANDLEKHLFVIASSEMEGRETATPGQKKAAAYIEEQFKAIGLLPGNNGSYQMYYNLSQDSVINVKLQINDKEYFPDKDFTINISQNIPATYRFSEIIFAGEGRMDSKNNDYKNIDVKGKAVLIVGNTTILPSGSRLNINDKIEAARKNGAAVLVIITLTEDGKLPQNTKMKKGNLNLSSFKKYINPQQFYISVDVAKAIMDSDFNNLVNNDSLIGKAYHSNILMSIEKQTNSLQSSNVIGLVEGSDKKDEYVFLTAHYDHLGKRDTSIYYGADDDGSGTVSVIEMAEAFAKAKAAGKGPRRTVVFMTVSGEEKGLLGSEYYSEHPVFPLEKTSVDLNTDMIGRVGFEYLKSKDSANYLYIIGDDKLSSDLAPIADKVNKQFNFKLDRKYNDLEDPNRFYFRSDHYNFAKKGVPVLFYFNGVHKDYHKPTDTVDKINFNIMEKRVRYIFLTAWEIANRDNMLKRDIPLPETE